jgi:hypothetical protein
MADRGGFIVLHRKILDSWVWRLENSDHTKVALQLLLEANWKPTKIMRGGEMIEIPRGSCLVAERKLAERAGVGRQVCRTAIRLLVAGGFLTRDLTHGFSLITIVNYDTYQDRPDDANPAANPPLTHDQPTANPRLTRSEQGNKETSQSAAAEQGEFQLENPSPEPTRPPGWEALSDPQRKLLSRHLETVLRLWDLQGQFRGELKPTAERLHRVAQRLEAGATESECRLVLNQYATEAKRTGEGKWFDGVTNWRPDNFDRALGQAQGTTRRRRGGEFG